MRHELHLPAWAALFLIVSVIAAITGFFLIVGIMAVIARLLFVLFAVLFAALLIRHYARRLHR